MGVVESARSLMGIKTPEQVEAERMRDLQERQVKAQSRIPASETAQGMALLKSTAEATQYELGALALDPNPDIEEFKSQLRGYTLVQIDDNGSVKTVRSVFGEPAMNDDGINYVVRSLRLYGSKTFSLTNYSGTAKDKNDGKEMIHKRCKIAGVKMAAALALNRVAWNVDPIKRSTIIDNYCNILEASLLRSLDMQTATKYWGTQKSLVHMNQNIGPDPIKPKSMFGGG